MSDRLEMLEGTLNLMQEGVAILDAQSNIVFWNAAATSLTGYSADDVVCQRCPKDLYCIDEKHQDRIRATAEEERGGRASALAGYRGVVAAYTSHTPLLHMRPQGDEEHNRLLQTPTLATMLHRQGHSVPVMLRKMLLRDSRDAPSGTVLLFYPVEQVDALPHGEIGDEIDFENSLAQMEDRLDAAQHQWVTNRVPFGLLWIAVDQAREMRKTHGRDACEAMLQIVEQTLLRQMNPTEVIGRWGDDEFLVLAHERTMALLIEHARRLAGLARTAEFRWWGDRIGLTISIGVSQAFAGDTLQCLLQRTRQAMQTSSYAGGNRVTEARGA